MIGILNAKSIEINVKDIEAVRGGKGSLSAH